MEKFFVPFLLSFALTSCAILVMLFLHDFLPKNREERGRVQKRVSRFGGVAIVLSFITLVLVNPDLVPSLPLSGLLLGAVLVLVFGLVDDMLPLPWWWQLPSQVLLGVLIFFFGMQAWTISNPFGEPILLHPETFVLPSLLLGVFWMVLMMNAINWIDGVDGVLGGVSLVALATIFALSFRPEVNQPAVAILAAIASGSSFGFLVFNMPPAKILAGTAGSFFIGFLVASLSLFAGVKIATALLVLALPVFDSFFVIVGRIRSGSSVFRGGDGRHLHDKLRLLGWSDRFIALSYTASAALLGFAAVSLPASGKFCVFAAAFLAFAFIFGLVEKKWIATPDRNQARNDAVKEKNANNRVISSG